MRAYLCTESPVVNDDSGPQPLAVMQRRYAQYTFYIVIIGGEPYGIGLSDSVNDASFLSVTDSKSHNLEIAVESVLCNWTNFQLTGDQLFDLDFVPAQLPYVTGV